jgi:hypothetical protein
MNDILAFEWKRDNIFERQGKVLAYKWKQTFIGLTETQVRAKLMEDMKIYNIWAIDVYRSKNDWCKVIYINFGGMAIHFDKHTRRVISAY